MRENPNKIILSVILLVSTVQNTNTWLRGYNYHKSPLATPHPSHGYLHVLHKVCAKTGTKHSCPTIFSSKFIVSEQDFFLDSRLSNRSVSLPASLHVVRVYARCRTRGESSFSRLLTSVVVNVLDVEGVDVSGDVTEKCQADVDEQV